MKPSEKRSRSEPNRFLTEGAVCKIECYNQNGSVSGYAEIDLEDLSKVTNFKWYRNGGYIVSGCKVRVLLHKVIMSPDNGSKVDHISRNTWDNKKSNLRVCNHSENLCNSGKKMSNTSGFKGVFGPRNGKWGAQIKKDGVIHYLGSYTNKIIAAMTYNQAALELHGSFAVLNKIPLIRRQL